MMLRRHRETPDVDPSFDKTPAETVDPAFRDPNLQNLEEDPNFEAAFAGNAEAPEEAPEDGFDPGGHTVAEVLAYVEENPDQRERVAGLEQAGKARKGVLEALDDSADLF